MQKTKDSLSDEDLMVLFQNGDVASFEILYRRHSPKVFSYLGKRIDREFAPDLLQEIFMKLHQGRHLYSNRYPFLPWLFTITRNALIDFARAKEIRILRESEPFVDGISEETTATPATVEDLAGAVARLPDQQRRAIELRYQQDWSFEQIAVELRTSPVNVRQIISRALRQLRTKGGFANE